MPPLPTEFKRHMVVATAFAMTTFARPSMSIGGYTKWTNPEGGFWSSSAAPHAPSNWDNDEEPSSSESALFNLGTRPAGYEVILNASPTTRSLKVTDDHVTLNLNGARYTLTDTDISLAIATEAPDDFASLVLKFPGTIDTAASIDIASGGIGALSVIAGAALHVGTEDNEAGILLHPNAVLNIDGGEVFTPHLFDLGGKLNLAHGTLMIHEGDMTLHPGDPFGGILTIGDDTHVGVGATLDISPDAAVLLNGGLFTPGILDNAGAFVATSGALASSGIFLRAGSTTDLFPGTNIDLSGGTLEVKTNANMSADGTISTHIFTNRGGFTTVQGQLNTTGPSRNTNIATMTAVTAMLNFPGDGSPNTIGLVNEGTLTLAGTTINGDVHNTFGSRIDVASGVVFNGLVSGHADFPGAGTVTFNGGYDPGEGPFFTTFDGAVALGPSNTLRIDVASPPDRTLADAQRIDRPPTPIPGVDFDQIVINSSEGIILDGHLLVNLVMPAAEPPPIGTVYPILLFDTHNGSNFKTIDGTLINTSFAFAPLFQDFNGDTIEDQLILRASIPGDLNFDNKVSVADLSELALHFNTTTGLGSWELGDFTSDGKVTIADLSLLALNFNFTLHPDGSTARITPLTVEEAANLAGINLADLPEPASLSLLMIAPCFQSCRRHSRR